MPDGIGFAGHQGGGIRWIPTPAMEQVLQTSAKNALLVPTASVSDHCRVCAMVAVLTSMASQIELHPKLVMPPPPTLRPFASSPEACRGFR